MIPCTLGHGKDVSEGLTASMFGAENSVDEINRFLNPSAWGYLTPSSYCDVGRLFYGVFNPSAWGHLTPSSYCDVGRLFYGVFKLWSKLQRKK